MGQIYVSKETFEKLKDSPKDKKTAMLLSKFDPNRSEKPKYKDYKTKRKMERINEVRKTGTFRKNDKVRVLYENGEISLEEYEKRKLDQSLAGLSEAMKKIRIKAGLEKRKRRKIRHVHVKGLGFSNQSVFRADDKDLWPYRK